jgi:hypothetical protein
MNLKHYYLNIVCVIVIVTGCSKSEDKRPVTPVKDRHVFICTGNSALRYHFDRSCPGLAKCKHPIITTTVVAAQKRGRTMCGWE